MKLYFVIRPLRVVLHTDFAQPSGLAMAHRWPTGGPPAAHRWHTGGLRAVDWWPTGGTLVADWRHTGGLLEPLQQRGVEQVPLRQGDGGVGQLSAGEGGQQSEGGPLVGRLCAGHVLLQIAHRVRVVEAARDAAAVR